MNNTQYVALYSAEIFEYLKKQEVGKKNKIAYL